MDWKQMKAASPAYQAMSDEAFLGAVYRKHYADKMSLDDFAKRVGYGQSDPTQDMSTADKFWAGAGKSVADMWHGGRQLAGLESEADAAEREAQDAPLMATGAGKTGYVSGTVATLVTPGSALKVASKVPQLSRAAPVLNIASRAFLPTTARGAAAQGAFMGALQPRGAGDSLVGNMLLGAGAGATGVLLPRGVGATFRASRNAALAPTTSGAQREAVRTIQGMVDDPTKLMTAQPSNIPGVQRTLFEESLQPGIARLETRSRGTANGWKEFDAANDAARQGAIRQFAGDEASLDAAIAARGKATNPLYASADKVTGVDTSRLISQIKRLENAQGGRPAVQRGLSDVRNLLIREVGEQERKRNALAAMTAFATTGRKSGADYDAARAAMTMIRRGEIPSGDFASQAGQDALKAARKAMQQTHAGVDDMRTISNVRLTINDMLSGKYGGDSGQAMAGSRALMAAKGQLDRVAAKASPEFAQATQTFRDMSRPINQQQAGQRLLAQASSRNLDPQSGLYPLVSGQYGGKVKALNKLVQDAAGFRKATAAGTFTPNQLATIGNVQDDLSRSAARLPYGNGGGSHTASQGELAMRMAGKALLRKVPWLGGAIEHLDDVAQKRVTAALDEMLRNPAEYRRVAAALPASERKLVEQAFVRIGGTSGALSLPIGNALAE